MRAEEPQELSIGLDQPEGSLEVFVGAREESLDDPARGPENHEYVGRLGLPHLLVRPGVDRPSVLISTCGATIALSALPAFSDGELPGPSFGRKNPSSCCFSFSGSAS